MSIDQVISLVSAIGSVFSGFSIFTVFLIYNIEKRDDGDAIIRQSLYKIKDSLNKINNMFTTELFCEMAQAVIYSESSSCGIEVLHQKYMELYEAIKSIKDKRKKEAKITLAAKQLKELADAIPASCMTSAVERLENSIYSMTESALRLAGQYKAIFYLIDVIVHLLLQILSKYKKIMLDSWDDVFEIMLNNNITPNNVDQFKLEICRHLVGIPNMILHKHDQMDIDIVLEMSQIVIEAYLSKTKTALARQRNRERSVNLNSLDEIGNYPDMFVEVQKSFRSVLSRDDEIKYSNLIRDFINNNTKK